MKRFVPVICAILLSGCVLGSQGVHLADDNRTGRLGVDWEEVKANPIDVSFDLFKYREIPGVCKDFTTIGFNIGLGQKVQHWCEFGTPMSREEMIRFVEAANREIHHYHEGTNTISNFYVDRTIKTQEPVRAMLVCPEGFVLGADNMCIPAGGNRATIQAQCPPGQTLHNGICVPVSGVPPKFAPKQVD